MGLRLKRGAPQRAEKSGAHVYLEAFEDQASRRSMCKQMLRWRC